MTYKYAMIKPAKLFERYNNTSGMNHYVIIIIVEPVV